MVPGLTKLAVHFGPGLDGGDRGDNGPVRHNGAIHLDLLRGGDAGTQRRCRLKFRQLLVEQLQDGQIKTPETSSSSVESLTYTAPVLIAVPYRKEPGPFGVARSLIAQSTHATCLRKGA